MRPPLAAFTTICLFLLTMTSAQDTMPDNEAPSSNMTCQPFGLCEPCPAAALSQPFCQPFGNRRLMHCQSPSASPSGSSSPSPPSPSASTAAGEHLAWGSCGRIVGQERADFYEFIACNLFFAVVALFVLFARSRRLRLIHARQLAARIGLTRGRR